MHVTSQKVTCGASLAVCLTLLSFGAQADGPLYSVKDTPVPFSWTGCYLGANVGGIWSRTDSTWVSQIAGPGGRFSD
jgi:hypothetical protein